MENENNLAYDLSEYEPVSEETAERDIGDEKPKKLRKARKTISIFKAFAIAAAAFLIFGSIIYGRVQLTSLYSEQSELETELAELQNENMGLESELAKKTGLTKVEDYAENRLGLHKLDRTQIKYVEVPKPSVAENEVPEDDNIFVMLKRRFNDFLEYIGA
ncbi:MAG: septum formation inhibitor [Ruminococcus sp.]|nr:septum formation inhibitor [Ruminococcus sp.]